MLEIKNLFVNIENKEILKDIKVNFEISKTYFLLGRNGSGKSSLSYVISGNPKYKIKSGKIFLDNKDITNLSPDFRSKAGIFLSFQNIPEIPGIKLSEFLRTIYNFHKKNLDQNYRDISPFLFKKFILNYLNELQIPENFLDRELNIGFSGGEKRKIELLQIKLLEPKYIILDEIDSGLDIDAFKLVLNELIKIKNDSNTLIFITHNFKILENIKPDEVIVMEKGQIVADGGIEIIEKIEKSGFCSFCSLDSTCKKELKCE